MKRNSYLVKHKHRRPNKRVKKKLTPLFKRDFFIGIGLILFGFLIGMLLLFPENVLEISFPILMNFIRELFVIAFLGGVAVLLVLPISFLDIRFASIITRELNFESNSMILKLFEESNLSLAWSYISFLFVFIILIELFLSIIGYKFALLIRELLSKKIKPKNWEKSAKLIKKFGPWGMFLAASIPIFPYTIAIYVSGATKVPFKPFIWAIIGGRIIKWIWIILIALGILNIF
jgi:hypothetical protein